MPPKMLATESFAAIARAKPPIPKILSQISRIPKTTKAQTQSSHPTRRASQNNNKKAKKAMEYDVVPVICVGESLDQRKQDIHFDLFS